MSEQPGYEAWLFDLDGTLVGIDDAYVQEVIGRVGDRLGIGDWFEAVVCCDGTTGWKPDPRPVELALADLGVDAGTPRAGVTTRGSAPAPLIGD